MEKVKTGNGATFIDVVSKEPRLTKFSEAIKTAGLTEKFAGPVNYTVFAPTDEAFNKLPQDKVTALLKPENREQLRNLMLLHLVPGAFKVDDLKKAASIKTEAGREIKVAVSGVNEIKIGNAKLVQPRQETTNWCLYGVDSILMPAATTAASA